MVAILEDLTSEAEGTLEMDQHQSLCSPLSLWPIG